MEGGEAAFSGTARFRLERPIGKGGMGAVYQAYDTEREAQVALKLLTRVDARSLYRFKNEFRVLAQLSHPNLVALHELVNQGSEWFLTMELVEGVSFLEHVRGDAPSLTVSAPVLARLRACFAQLCRGLVALHQADVLHRDLKPSNVLVTADERVVLLDFGVATEIGAEGFHETWMNQVVGTLAYMSPEQAAGLPLSVPSDWYSVGVMLYEALTGVLPLGNPPADGGESTQPIETASSWMELVMSKQTVDPPPPSALVAGVPADLDRLCAGLLQRRPEARPTAEAVLAAFEDLETPIPRALPALAPAPVRRHVELVGRSRELALLESAFERAAGGSPSLVLVGGPSGIGKTELVRHFLAELQRSQRAIVLEGRCFERELVPYKGLDGLMDSLCHHLGAMPLADAAALVPADVHALVRVFPVLGGIVAVQRAPRRDIEGPDPQSIRRRAFDALGELVGRLGANRPLVLFVDDLQWSDPDSAARLAEILLPTPRHLLLVASHRDGRLEDGPVTVLRERVASAVELPVGPLAEEDARALARTLVAGTTDVVDAVARESGGNPLFLEELARHAAESGARPRGVALADLIEARLDRLPPATRRLLEVVAVAGQPVEEAVALRAAELDAGGHAAIDELRRAHLVTSAAGGAVQPSHDRISELIASRLDDDQRARLHLAVARALEDAVRIDPEVLAVHYRAAGAGERAIRYVLVAAAQAAEGLAFHRAARLYEVALDLWTGDDAGRRRILADRGDALAHAGHGPEAARAFAAAAELTPGVEGLELRRRAAEQLLRSGHIDDGLAALERVLAADGLRLALTPRRAVLSLLARRARVRLRGLGFAERVEVELDPAVRARIDTCWSVAVVFGMVDPIRASDFQSRHLLLALDAGDPPRIARALVTEAVYSATRGVAAARGSAELVAAAAAIAARTGKPYERAFATLGAGMVAYWEGRHLAARDLCEEAERIFRDECPGIIWEVSSTRIVGIWSLCYLGQLGELRRRVLAYLSEAEERGDLYLATSVQTGVPSLAWLSVDDPDGARRHLLEGMKLWSQRGFHVQHYWKFLAQTQIDLYAGDGESAWMRVAQSMPALRRSLLLRVAVVRVEASYLRGRAAVAAAAAVPVGERRPFLRAADGEAAALTRSSEPWARPLGLAIAAGAAAVRGESDRAAELYGQAAALFDGAGMALHAGVSRRRRGQLLGGDEGAGLVTSAAAVIGACGVAAADRMSALLAPGVAE